MNSFLSTRITIVARKPVKRSTFTHELIMKYRWKASDQDGHKLGEKRVLQPSEHDLQSLYTQQK
jgi:hypothetical protein